MSDASILFILVLASGGFSTDALHGLISKGILLAKVNDCPTIFDRFVFGKEVS